MQYYNSSVDKQLEELTQDDHCIRILAMHVLVIYTMAWVSYEHLITGVFQ